MIEFIFRAISYSCTNALWPDTHGHYREAQFTQTKHHWWWKANWIFSQITPIKAFDGLVLFLEEDHYVAEDFLHVLKLLETEKKSSKYNIDMLSLGTYLRKNNVRPNPRQVRFDPSIFIYFVRSENLKSCFTSHQRGEELILNNFQQTLPSDQYCGILPHLCLVS